MTHSAVADATLDDDAAERQRIWRDALAMTLYVAIVLLAELVVLPAGREDGENVHGPVGWELIAIVWGTTIGLALAHLFAFRVATQGLSRGRLRGWDRLEAFAELAGAAVVAAIASFPVLVFRDRIEQQVVPIVLSSLIGVVGYLVERASGRSRATAALFGVVALAAALVVAILKAAFAGH